MTQVTTTLTPAALAKTFDAGWIDNADHVAGFMKIDC